MSAQPSPNGARPRAAVFNGNGRIAQVEAEPREPGPGEVLVRLQGCGVCASNLPVWEGRPWFRYPLPPGAPGHEGWGLVEAVGKGVTEIAEGARVAMVSANAYATHDVTSVDTVVQLPPELNSIPFPGEPLGCVMNIFRRSEILSGQTVAIVGIGFLGAALTALAREAGARVIAISRRSFALNVAEHYGASNCIRLDDAARALSEARDIIGPNGCERVIEAVGTQEALDLASELAGVRSRLVIAGYHQEGTRTVNLQRWNWLGLDVINAHERDPLEYRRGMEDAVRLVRSGRFDPTPLYTHRFPLEDLSTAFQLLAERPHGFLKALVTCE